MEPESRMSAREYFQLRFHPKTERVQQSFDWSQIRLNMQASGYSQGDIEKTYRELVGFEGRFSNDYPIEIAINELIGNTPSSVSQKIQECYFAKVSGNEWLNAYISRLDGAFSGSLAIISVSFSDMIWRYARTFALMTAPDFIPLSEDEKRIVDEVFGVEMENLAKIEVTFHKGGATEAFKVQQTSAVLSKLPKRVENFAILLAAQAQNFIVFHEIAHHVLRHVEQNDEFFEHTGIISLGVPGLYTQQHQWELNADSLSLMFMSGRLSIRDENYRLDPVSIIGMLIGLTTLGQRQDATQRTITHPSILDRLDWLEGFTRIGLPVGEKSSIFSITKSWHRKLVDFQGFGIAKNTRQKPSESATEDFSVSASSDENSSAYELEFDKLIDVMVSGLVQGGDRYNEVIQFLTTLDAYGWDLRKIYSDIANSAFSMQEIENLGNPASEYILMSVILKFFQERVPPTPEQHVIHDEAGNLASVVQVDYQALGLRLSDRPKEEVDSAIQGIKSILDGG